MHIIPSEQYAGREFPIDDLEVTSSCVDYWFDAEEVVSQTANNALVPKGYSAIARDPGDDLILLQNSTGHVFYCLHETGRLIQIADSLDDLLKAILLGD